MFKTFGRMLSVYLMFAMVIITLPAQGWAMFIPSGQNGARQADISAIQKSLESRVVQQRLADLGLSHEEAMARINKLSDEQVHQFASKLDSLQAGGDAVDALLFVLLVAVLVVGILTLTGHTVIVR